MAGRTDWKLGDHVIDDHKALHHPLSHEEEDSGLFVITVALSDEIYALNMQLGSFRKNSLSYKSDIFIMTTQKTSYTKYNPPTP